MLIIYRPIQKHTTTHLFYRLFKKFIDLVRLNVDENTTQLILSLQ